MTVVVNNSPFTRALIGDTKHDVAIEDGEGGFEVREYQAFTVDLVAIVAWLVSVGITTVAEESTGIYWYRSLYSPI